MTTDAETDEERLARYEAMEAEALKSYVEAYMKERSITSCSPIELRWAALMAFAMSTKTRRNPFTGKLHLPLRTP